MKLPLSKPFVGLSGLAALLCATTALAGEIAGTVQSAQGKAMAGVRVQITDLMRSTSTDAEGKFHFDWLPEGSVAVDVSSPFYASQREVLQVPREGAVEAAFALAPNTELARAAALRSEPQVEHAAQKQAYLSLVEKSARGQKTTKKFPNIVVILFDDLGYGDLSSFGNKLIATPHIDALARRGAKLTQSYSASPVCTPSRAGLLTGRLPVRSSAANHVFFPTGHPVATMRRSLGWANALPRDEITLAEVFSHAGYATGAFGKWHLGDVKGSRPNDLGFQSYFGVHYSNDMAPLAIYRDEQVDTAIQNVRQETLNERFADEAINFIRKNKDRSFFAYVPFTAPHWPHHPSANRAGKSAGGHYGDVVEDLDDQVGRIVSALDALDIVDETIIVVTSDNGGDYDGAVGDLRGRKGETWEGGMRVPQFIAWPGVTRPGTTIDAMTMNIDLFPSLLAMRGIPLPSDRIVDGRDIRSMLSGATPSPHQYLYYLTTWTAEVSAVRNAKYKYREPVDDTSPLGGAGKALHPTPALYDLEKDNEAHNIINRHPEVTEDLKRQITALRAEIENNRQGWKMLLQQEALREGFGPSALRKCDSRTRLPSLQALLEFPK